MSKHKKTRTGFTNGKPGIEKPIYYGIRKSAIQAWNELKEAQDREMAWNCKNNPYFYIDYDGRGFEDEDGLNVYEPVSDEQAELLCFGCPLIRECYNYALAADEKYGIWGGINFGKDSESKQ